MKNSTRKQFGRVIGFVLMMVMLFTSVQVKLYAEASEIINEIPLLGEIPLIEQDEEEAPKEHGSERVHQRFIYGFPDGTVRADISVTRGEAATIVFRLLEESNKFDPVQLYFSDVGHESWYSQAVNYLAHVGILLGYSDGTFRADEAISRAEFSAIIARFTRTNGSGQADFSDITHDHWAMSYISTVSENGWILGHQDSTFRPESQITRAEFIVIMNRVLGRDTHPDTIYDSLEGNTVFSDISPMHWAFFDIMEASVTHSYVINQNGREEWLSFYLPIALAY